MVRSGSAAVPTRPKRRRKQVGCAAKVLGVPVVAASPTLMVEGMWPWYIGGLVIGSVFGGALGVLRGVAVGYWMAGWSPGAGPTASAS